MVVGEDVGDILFMCVCFVVSEVVFLLCMFVGMGERFIYEIGLILLLIYGGEVGEI